MPSQPFFKELTDLYASREVLRQLISADLKLRFRRSILGYSWSLLYPMMTMFVLALVFHQLTRGTGPGLSHQDYMLYVFSGLIPWNFFVASCQACGISIINNELLMKKVYLPKLVFPYSVLIARFIDFLFNMLALFVIISLITFRPSLALLALPLVFLLLLVFMAGISMALCAITVHVRDVVHLTGVLMQVLFYATPIIYTADFLRSNWYYRYFELNPVVHFIRLFQLVIYEGRLPSAEQWGLATAIAVFTFLFGYTVYQRMSRNLIFRL